MSMQCPVCNNSIDENESVCPYCGFKLSGSTQQFQPVVLENESLGKDVKPVQAATLNVVRGPQVGVAFPLSDKKMTIGRSPKCDIFLNDMTVSRVHATIEPDQAGYVIRDENSFNGVWVCNKSIDEHHLESGDIIQIGVFILVFQEG